MEFIFDNLLSLILFTPLLAAVIIFTLPSEQKTLIRSLVDRVVLTRRARDQVEVKVVWVSGHYSSRTVQVPVGRQEEISNYDEMEQRIGELYREGKRDAYPCL